MFHTIFCRKDRYEIKAPQSLIALQHSSSCHTTSETIFSTIYMDVLTTIRRDSKLDIHSTDLIKYTYRGTVQHILPITCRTDDTVEITLHHQIHPLILDIVARWFCFVVLQLNYHKSSLHKTGSVLYACRVTVRAWNWWLLPGYNIDWKHASDWINNNTSEYSINTLKSMKSVALLLPYSCLI